MESFPAIFSLVEKTLNSFHVLADFQAAKIKSPSIYGENAGAETEI